MKLNHRSTSLARGDDGIAMVLTISIATLLLAASILAFAMATRSLNASQDHVAFEQRLHIAEQGVDETLARIQVDESYATAHPIDATLPIEDLDAAAVDYFNTASDDALGVESGPGGEYAVIKPPGRNVVYSAAWIPNRAEAQFSRMLKVEYLISTFGVEHAILTQGDLSISGNALAGGSAGHVHTNGSISTSGNSFSITGNLSAVGTIPNGTDDNVTGTLTAGAPSETVPHIDPLTLWEDHNDDYDDATGAPTYPNNLWWDLCAGGQVKLPDNDVSGPCTGTLVKTLTGAQNHFGWTYSSPSGYPTWTNNGGAVADGVFYVHQGRISLSGSPGTAADPWQVTVIASSRLQTGQTCFSDFGDVSIGGSPKMAPMIDNVAIVAARDLALSGSNSAGGLQAEGLVAAGEQVNLDGTANVKGAVVAENRCHTSGSPVSANTVGGNFNVVHDTTLDIPVAGVIRTALWLEM